MNYLRLFLFFSALSIAGCMTIGSFSYTTPEGRTVSVGFKQRQPDFKSTRGFQK
jgi:hypothetical protein